MVPIIAQHKGSVGVIEHNKINKSDEILTTPSLFLRSPPRPSPGSLHYSDEDVSTKYNDLIPAESSSLTEKPSEISDSQVTNIPTREVIGLCVVCLKQDAKYKDFIIE